MHGGQIIQNSLLPIGQLSEEAAEARNKHFQSHQLIFARKFSREECNLDVYNNVMWLLLSSEPSKPSRKAFLPETIELLMSAEPNREVVKKFSEGEDDVD